jgi:hypothetical protein
MLEMDARAKANRGTSDNFYCANGKQLNKESDGKEVDEC